MSAIKIIIELGILKFGFDTGNGAHEPLQQIQHIFIIIYS